MTNEIGPISMTGQRSLGGGTMGVAKMNKGDRLATRFPLKKRAHLCAHTT